MRKNGQMDFTNVELTLKKSGPVENDFWHSWMNSSHVLICWL